MNGWLETLGAVVLWWFVALIMVAITLSVILDIIKRGRR